jgi:hypothetical protein
MQAQSTTTTSSDTRHCSRCDRDLPLWKFGSHNYCTACYRAYLDNWKTSAPAKRRQAARQLLKNGLCVVCGTTPSRSGVCDSCNFGAQHLGIESEGFEDNLLNLLDHYNGYFDK